MSPPRVIVVATDFSEVAERATQYALELARKLDAQVNLVHAWAVPIVAYPDVTVPLPTAVIDDLAADAQRRMDEALKRHVTAGVRLGGMVVCGDAREALLEAAGKLKADLLVIGTHGRRGVRRAILGSVAESVVRTAGCPVLVVH